MSSDQQQTPVEARLSEYLNVQLIVSDNSDGGGMASKKLARQGSNILQHCWLSCFLSAGDNCHDPPSLFFSVFFLRKPITVAELLTIGTTTTRLIFVFLCFFFTRSAPLQWLSLARPLFPFFFSVFIVEFFFQRKRITVAALVTLSVTPGTTQSGSPTAMGNLTRHDLPSHNNTNLNHPVTTSHFPNSQNFPNLPKYKDKR